MSSIPPLTTLRVEDYPAEQRSWLPRLFLPLNQFLTSVNNCLSGRVEFGLNIPAVTQVFSFTYDGTARRITWTLSLAPAFLIIGQAFEGTTAIALLPIWTYDSSTKMVSFDFVKSDGSSLTVGTAYKITIRIMP